MEKTYADKYLEQFKKAKTPEEQIKELKSKISDLQKKAKAYKEENEQLKTWINDYLAPVADKYERMKQRQQQQQQQ